MHSLTWIYVSNDIGGKTTLLYLATVHTHAHAHIHTSIITIVSITI